MARRYRAPWSSLLTFVSGLLVVLSIGLSLLGAPVAGGLIAAGVVWAAVFAVLGYRVEPDAVVILRPGWTTRLPLDGIESAEADPDAMRAAIRVFGAGGPFALLGRFRSAAVGPFRAYATDRQRAVVLRWRSRTVVVTPDEPEAFAEEVRTAAGL